MKNFNLNPLLHRESDEPRLAVSETQAAGFSQWRLETCKQPRLRAR